METTPACVVSFRDALLLQKPLLLDTLLKKAIASPDSDSQVGRDISTD